MATHANTTVNETKQARTCTALMEAFHDADDAYAAAVERSDTDREAVTDARSEALVAFLTGPRPKNTAEATRARPTSPRNRTTGRWFPTAMAS